MNQINPNRTKLTLFYGRLMLHLDAGQIFPDDPGMGTPLLFEYRHSEYRRSGESTMTWTCAYEGGNLNEILPEGADEDKYYKWIRSIEEEVGEWEKVQWKLRLRKRLK